MIKTLNKLRIEENFLNLMKNIYNNSVVSIILNNERLNAFFLRSGTRQACLLSPLLFQITMDVLPSKIRQEKEIKGI